MKGYQLHASLTFERFDLNLTAINGVLSVSPASDEGYLPGTILTLTAIGEDGLLLDDWLGTDACEQETTCQITMPAQDLDIMVEFEAFNLEELRADIRYCGSDYHSAYNYHGGFYNQATTPNTYAFVALEADGSITAWGDGSFGGSGAPTDNGYISIYSNSTIFAALKSDGSITAWGSDYNGGSGAPTDTGYISIYSNRFAFAALKADGSITAWGE